MRIPVSTARCIGLSLIVLGSILPALTPTVAVAAGTVAPQPVNGVSPTAADELFFSVQNRSPKLSPLRGLGGRHVPVSTSNHRAKRFFRQGVAEYWAFQFGDAYESFSEAAQLDPPLAIASAWASFSLVAGSGLSGSPYRRALAQQIIARAVAQDGFATSRERAYISAIATCVQAATPSAVSCSTPLMQLRQADPRDDVATLLWIHSQMWFSWWNLFTHPQREPRGPLAGGLIRTVKRILAQDPTHPGALHMYLHIMEESARPERSTGAAKLMRSAAPDAEHFTHMPGHIYTYLGAYASLLRLDKIAIRQLDQRRRRLGVADMFYVGEQSHAIRYDVIYAAWAGDAKTSNVRSARLLREFPQYISALPWLELVYPNVLIAKVHLQQWSDILRFPQPPASLDVARAAWHWARGMAYSALGDKNSAATELTDMETSASRVPADSILSSVSAPRALEVLSKTLKGQIARRSGDLPGAIARLREAIKIQSHLAYEEPEMLYPVGEVLGSIYLEARQPRKAISAFDRPGPDLYRGYGRALIGKAAAYRQLRQTRKAAQFTYRFREAWRIATIAPPNPYKY